MTALAALPPAVVVLAVAVALAGLPRRAGHALGVATAAGVAAWSYVVPAGAYLSTTFLGFDAVLFHVDAFSRLMGIVFGVIGAAAVLYSYASDARNVQTAYALSYVGTSLGAVFAGDWLTLVFFWELMAVTSTLLVWDHGGPAVRAGFRYAVFHAVGGSLLMAAVVWHYVAVGSFLFSAAAGITPGVPAALAALGIGVNVGFVGLHAWLPDTYPRPHVAASVFLCVYTTKTGVYGLARAFPDGNLLIAYMGAAMAVVGVVFALLQNDMRRLLSYHIQSQVGYMVAGVGIGTAAATAGAFAHVYNHILYKALLFMTVGVVIYRTGEESLKYLGGLYRELPLTALAFFVAALSISGFPGFNGFVSKGLITAAAHHEHLEGIYYLLLAAGVGTFMSFIKLGYYAFVREAQSDRSLERARPGQSVAMLSVAGLCVLYGLYPDALFAILPGSTADAHPFTLEHIGEGLVLAALGLVGFAAAKRPLERVGRIPDIDAAYNPLTFYGARALVRAVTETFAAVDRALVGATGAVVRATSNPAETAIAVASRLPGDAAASLRDADGEPAPLHLRASIATSVLLVVTALAGALLLLVT